ncbi:hypothetical protein M758_4G058900 [Ceratodon purpureus]|nr:hypothetical protein M758_4G058900 [Ceratodon purpureus]
MLKKRAYLAPFLVDIDIPPELILEDDVNVLYTQFHVLQDHFKSIHKHLEEIRKKDKDPILLKEGIQGLEIEKNHLYAKIQKLNIELQHVNKLGEYLDVIQCLQDQMSIGTSLADQLQEQEYVLDLSVNEAKVISRLHHMQDLIKSDSISIILQKVGQTCSLLQYSTNEKLPKEIEAKKLRLQALQQVLSTPNHVDFGLSNIQAKLILVNEDLKALKQSRQELQRDHNGHGDDSTIRGNEVQRQQVQMTTIVANKIRNVYDKLGSLNKQRDVLIGDLQYKLNSIEEVKRSVRRGEELKQYVELLRGKTATYKTLKKEVDDMTNEYDILIRTQQLLEQQVTCHEIAMDQKAKYICENGSNTAEYELIRRTKCMLQQQANGPSIASELSNFANKPPIDNILEQDLQIQSKKVWQHISELNMKLEDQRAEVAPLRKQLKDVRTILDKIEAQHNEQQSNFTNLSLAYERKFATLESSLITSRMEFEVTTKQLEESTLDVERLEAALEKLTIETKDSVVSDELHTRIQLQEELASTLHQKQQKLKEVEHNNKAQIDMMKDLLNILAVKLALYSSEMRPAIYSTNSALENVKIFLNNYTKI